MKNYTESRLICPICKSPLEMVEAHKIWRCHNGHSYDIARQGYINLLTSNQKGSKAPGDSKEMVDARSEFLIKGFYNPLSDAINKRIATHIRLFPESEHTLLDIGCGEGYYLSRLKSYMDSKSLNLDTYGMDISKDAVKAASSRVKSGNWLVANSHRIPLANKAFDAILSVFSPIDSSEVARLLKANGIFIRVLPGPDHLIQMRRIIYPEVIISPEHDPCEGTEGLVFTENIPVTYTISLTTAELTSLVKMTPHYWKTTKADKEALNDVKELTVTVDMRILVYRIPKEAPHV